MKKNKSVSSYNLFMNIWNGYRWELFVCVSIIVIIICWFLKKEDEEYKGIDIDTTVLNSSTPKTPLKSTNPLTSSSPLKKLYKNEEKCRDTVQDIYKCVFKKVRPEFLKNPKTGRNLELDIYNNDLKIAVEYNGIQHRTYAPYFHKSPDDYLAQVQRDEFKKKRCKEVGITLIVVPDTVRYHEIEEYIKSQLKKEGKL